MFFLFSDRGPEINEIKKISHALFGRIYRLEFLYLGLYVQATLTMIHGGR